MQIGAIETQPVAARLRLGKEDEQLPKKILKLLQNPNLRDKRQERRGTEPKIYV